jgi:hypothetical protein
MPEGFMKTECLIRKRIWEVDCLSLDAALAGSFDWRELANFIQGAGVFIDEKLPDAIKEINCQNIIHQYCHEPNDISLNIENLLNRWHTKIIDAFSIMTVKEAHQHIMTISFEKNKDMGGLFWALGSDPRDGFCCLRRHFHQRVQIYSIRKLL